VIARRWAASVLLLGLAAGATTIIRQDVPDLSRQADAVIRGTVSRAESRWSGDRRTIFTEVEIQVAETLKGPARKTVIVREPGGVVGNIGQRVDGVASFQKGEEVVVFLARRPDDSFAVEGMAQGKFRVERSSDGRAAFAVRGDVDALVLDPATGRPVQVEQRSRTLDELRGEIRSALAAPPQPTAPMPVPRPLSPTGEGR
jgi:hypothetical protein